MLANRMVRMARSRSNRNSPRLSNPACALIVAGCPGAHKRRLNRGYGDYTWVLPDRVMNSLAVVTQTRKASLTGPVSINVECTVTLVTCCRGGIMRESSLCAASTHHENLSNWVWVGAQGWRQCSSVRIGQCRHAVQSVGCCCLHWNQGGP